MLTEALSFPLLLKRKDQEGAQKSVYFPVCYGDRTLVCKLLGAVSNSIVEQWTFFLSSASGCGGTTSTVTLLEQMERENNCSDFHQAMKKVP